MSFEALVENAFVYGCGTSTRFATRDSAYICRYENELHPALPDDTALAILLGNELTDRAFRNIPWKLRRRIGEWNNGVESQLRFLNDVCKELTNPRWRRMGNRSYVYNSDVRSVLPASTGSWWRGKIQPNCLGVAQMMVGLMRAMNATHRLANVVQANQDTQRQYEVQALKVVAAQLEEFSDFGEFAKSIGRAYLSALESTQLPKQAHHLVVVQLADDSWWAVDPYLNAFYPFPDNDLLEYATAYVEQNPNRVVTIRPDTPVEAYINRIEQRMRALEFACMLHNGRFGEQPELNEPVLDLLGYVAGFTQTEMPTDLEQQAMEMWQLELTVADPHINTDELESAAMFALIYAANGIDDLSTLTAIINEDVETEVNRMFEQKRRALTDYELERRLSTRLVRFILKDFLLFLERLGNDPDTRQHSCMEVVWAPLGIAVATLNHMQGAELRAANNSIQMPTLGGKLPTLLPGQWIVHDALALAHEKGEDIRPDYLAVIRQKLEKIREVPHMMIDPLRLIDFPRK